MFPFSLKVFKIKVFLKISFIPLSCYDNFNYDIFFLEVCSVELLLYLMPFYCSPVLLLPYADELELLELCFVLVRVVVLNFVLIFLFCVNMIFKYISYWTNIAYAKCNVFSSTLTIKFFYKKKYMLPVKIFNLSLFTYNFHWFCCHINKF